MKYINETKNEFEFIEYSQKSSNEYHCHTRIEILHVIKGHGRFRCGMGEIVYDLRCGDYAVIKNLDIHRIISYADFAAESILFPVSFRNMLELDYIKSSFVVTREIMEKHTDEMHLSQDIMQLVSKTGIKESLLKSLCASLCSLLLNMYPERLMIYSVGNDDLNFQNVQIKGNVSIDSMERFDKVLEYIKTNFTDTKLNLPSVSKMFGFNSTYLSALFPKLSKQNFKDYVRTLKINYAIELLLTTDRNISEVAYNCGFETIRSFNNVFKSLVGTTPSDFLKANKGQYVEGIETEIQAVGKNLFDYRWTSNVKLVLNKQAYQIEVMCNIISVKLWCHLRVRMLFFANKIYSVSYKAKYIGNAYANYSESIPLKCDFYFPDNTTKVEHHTLGKFKTTKLIDGWIQYETQYKIPDYYVPSTEDLFSVFSDPYEDVGVSFAVKDIEVKIKEK